MLSFGLYLCDEDGSQCGPELHQIVMEFCEEHHRAETSSVPQNDDDDESVDSVDSFLEDGDPPTTPTCLGCVEDQPNQLAHMDHGGCLHNPDDDDLTDEDLAEVSRLLNFDDEEPLTGQDLCEAAPDILVVSLDRDTRWSHYAGNYWKSDRRVRGAPLFIKTSALGKNFFLFRGKMGHWLFGDDEQDIEMSAAAISSTSCTESLPCEQGIQYEVASDTDAINDDDGWIVDESIVVRATRRTMPSEEVVWLGGGARN
jgi:hypothetical protein